MRINWRKVNNVLHRDVGYFFFGMSIIYALSGIALNHIADWDPNYIIENKSVQVDPELLNSSMNAEEVKSLLKVLEINHKFKKHYYPNAQTLKIFVAGGSFTANLKSGRGFLETVDRRPILYEVNYLHYNHTKFLWTWFSDLFAVGLILLAITGLFVLKGKNGFQKRGVWFVIGGTLIPLVFLLFYL